MLRAYALADLFSANLAEPIFGIFLTTTSGHLCGYSPPANASAPSPASMRKLAVLCALTWRVHSAGFARSNLSRSASTQNSASTDDLAAQAAKSARIRPLPILGQTLDDQGTLSGFAAKGEDRVVSLGFVGEGLLVGVVGAEMASAAHGNHSVRSTVERSAESDDDEASDAGTEHEDTGHSAQDLAWKAEQEARDLGTILGVKADALAEFLREELGGFKMPKELE
jgi:hypothetical protein